MRCDGKSLTVYISECLPVFARVHVLCPDIDECTLDGICDPHATCHNLPGSFECTCNSGYVGSGIICESINTTNGTNTTDSETPHFPFLKSCQQGSLHVPFMAHSTTETVEVIACEN
ncbi:calcium binding EGF domain protein [Ostertagia ostertagi]